MNIPYTCLSPLERRSLYARMNREYINTGAVFSDETENYVSPFNPCAGDGVSIKLRAARGDAERVFIHFKGADGTSPTAMIKTDGDALFDYWQAALTMGADTLVYYFSVEKNGRVYYYNKRGLYETADPAYHFRIIPGFSAPEWARGALMYQIFVDRFYNGDTSNDPVDYEYIYLGKPARASEWGADVPADDSDICNFYGGDLRGVMEKMSYLKSLGVEAVYLNPIFVSPSSHKYDIQDYDHVDPHFGAIVKDGGETLRFERFNNRYATKYAIRTADPANLGASDKLLADMIALAHENGIRVILDGVFNHCGSFNKWLDKAGFYAMMSGDKNETGAADTYPPGAYRDERSPYHDYFLWFDRDWPNNDCYDGWWGNENHPKLNYEDSPKLREYILNVARKWVSPPYNADGWRLDVPYDLGRSSAFNHKFWQDFRSAVKTANPNAIILGECYGDPSGWISGGEWDTVMNYDAFMEPISWFLTGMEKHSEESRPVLINDAMTFENAMRFNMARFNIHSLQTAMNELSNHDHSRFLTRTNHAAGRLRTAGSRAAEQNVNKNVLMEAVVFQMTWPGAPTIYYGDEAGLAGWTDPDNRRPYPWGKEDAALLELHRAMAALRKRFPVLRNGSVEFLYNNHGFISFGRWGGSGGRVVVALNNTQRALDVSIPVWKIGVAEGRLKRLLGVHGGKIHTEERLIPVENGRAKLIVPAEGAVVLGE